MKPERLVIAMILVLTTLASGCWNRREIETLGFVTAAGLDRSENGQITVTVQIAKPFALGGESQSSQKPFWVVSTTGATTFDAVRRLLAESPRRPFWQHNRFILIGEELARSGIRDAIDFFYRDGETRTQAIIVIAKGITARELLQGEFQLEPMPAEGGFGIIQGSRLGLSTISPITLHEFLQRLEGHGIEPNTVGAHLIEEQPKTGIEIGGELVRERIKSRPRVTGGAVFKGDRLIGWLDEIETRGMLWVQGRARSSIVVVPHPGREGKHVGLEMLMSTSSITPSVDTGRLVMNVDISAEANIGDVQFDIDPEKSPSAWTDLEQSLAGALQIEALRAIRSAQNLGSDVFGFGRAVSKQMPANWQTFKDSWDDMFRELEVSVTVRTKLRRYGLLQRAVKIK